MYLNKKTIISIIGLLILETAIIVTLGKRLKDITDLPLDLCV